MKFVLAVAFLMSVCAVALANDDVCHDEVIFACKNINEGAGVGKCNSRYGGIDEIEKDVQAYLNLELSKSYEYLLLATHFNSYQKNRPGFQQLYQGLSDRSFENTIDLIKQVTRRGGSINFNLTFGNHNQEKDKDNTISTTPKAYKTLDVDELHSLAIALDDEKELTGKATHVHYRATHHHPVDPEMAHYMEEKFLTSQAKSVRQLSGYVHDLSKLMKQSDPSLAVFLFDEYLQKQK